jgi:hypothetical protein
MDEVYEHFHNVIIAELAVVHQFTNKVDPDYMWLHKRDVGLQIASFERGQRAVRLPDSAEYSDSPFNSALEENIKTTATVQMVAFSSSNSPHQQILKISVSMCLANCSTYLPGPKHFLHKY